MCSFGAIANGLDEAGERPSAIWLATNLPTTASRNDMNQLGDTLAMAFVALAAGLVIGLVLAGVGGAKVASARRVAPLAAGWGGFVLGGLAGWLLLAGIGAALISTDSALAFLGLPLVSGGWGVGMLVAGLRAEKQAAQAVVDDLDDL